MASLTAPSTSEDVTAADKKRNYARIAELTWIWSIVGYSILRFVIAWGAFAEHGANVWIFGLIDVGTAWPYAKSVAIVCKRAANSNWAHLPVPLALALSTFFAPYAYLWFAAGEMPAGVRFGMAICVSVLLLAAIAGVMAKTRKLRREDDAVIDLTTGDSTVVLATVDPEISAGQVIDLRSGDPNLDLVIDLTGDQVTLERSLPRS